jgi:hypothetical protein
MDVLMRTSYWLHPKTDPNEQSQQHIDTSHPAITTSNSDNSDAIETTHHVVQDVTQTAAEVQQ